MRGYDHLTILSPSFHGFRKERLAQNTTKNALQNMSLAAYASVAWDHALSLLSLYVSHVFPLELKKQRSKKQQQQQQKNNGWSQVKASETNKLRYLIPGPM